MDISVIFENDDFIIVNKPAGLSVHPDGKTDEKTLVDWVLSRYPHIKNVGEPFSVDGKEIPRPGIVHRIDRETSGALVVAKTSEAFTLFKNKFKNREIEKAYHLFVYGNIKRDDGMIQVSIGRSKSDFRKWAPEVASRGTVREAITYYQALKKTPTVSFVEARPKTGRTHQIRVHFKSIGYPVVCDSLYAAGKPKLLGFERLALHALRLSFEWKGENIAIDAKYPQDFQQALAALEEKSVAK
ncbi:MAG: RluA family pseudouridine synthase [Candidatus Pacebacteria bacterium]|nr:RluA family pseudouridine synthase [Candidatus Paceibacterota bacterium]